MIQKIMYLLFFAITPILGAQELTMNWEKLLKGKIEVSFIKNKSRFPGTRMMFILDAPREKIWPILLDNSKGTKIYKDIEKTSLIKEEKNISITEFWINAGVGKYNYVLMRTTNESVYEITWSRVSGDFNKIEGSWKLIPTPIKGRTLMIYETFVDIGYPVPLFIQKWVAKTKVKDLAKSLRRYFEMR